MKEPYLEYWGLEKHPFLLAPDSQMMYMAGQYFECLERLKYAVNTHKGGALIVSEDAGLGKTTILLKLIEELKKTYNDTFRYAFIDHPTLNSSQLVSFITKEITGKIPYDDKLKNIILLKDALIDIKRNGGKAIIIVDEGQMLCGKYDILQELRILINLNHENEYLHTFILSGQRPLWDEIKGLPEFWQRLPVRYYFVPLRVEETKELVKYRLNRAGLSPLRKIFTDEALELIHKHSKGSPRTILAMADMALLAGYTDRVGIIGFKEIYKAMNMMSGRGESMPYFVEKQKETKSFHSEVKSTKEEGDKPIHIAVRNKKPLQFYVRPFIIVLAFLFSILAGGLGYHYLFSSHEKKTQGGKIEKQYERVNSQEVEKEKIHNAELLSGLHEKPQSKVKTEKELIVIKPSANIRSAPHISAQRVGIVFMGERIKIKGEEMDRSGTIWYRVPVFGETEGWISEKVVKIK